MRLIQHLVISAAMFITSGIAYPQVDTTIGKTRPANPEIPGIIRAPGSCSQPTITGKPDNFSGVSGPGQPVTGTGYGGYRSGREGIDATLFQDGPSAAMQPATSPGAKIPRAQP